MEMVLNILIAIIIALIATKLWHHQYFKFADLKEDRWGEWKRPYRPISIFLFFLSFIIFINAIIRL